MDYMNKSIKEIHKDLLDKKVTPEELVNESLKKSKEIQEKYNAFVTIIDKPKIYDLTEDLLSGIPYAAKDNYSTKGILSTGSSNTLRDYIPVFDATSIENLSKKGAILTSKTVLDEFGMGGTGTTGHTGIVLNPWDKKRICAGSSAGSACAVAAGVYPYALGSDTGDSIRKPAAYTGIVGYKPTYGMISRYGLFPFASSLDTLGVLTRSVEDAAIVVDAMKGKDPKDMTSWDSKNIHLYEATTKKDTNKKLCYIKNICDIENYSNPSKELEEHLDNFKQKLETIRSLGFQIDGVTVDQNLLNAVSSVYAVISRAEATSNMANLTGISFGPRANGDNYIEMIKNFRTQNFSPLIKRRFVVGSYVLQAENKERYFYNAQRVRRLLVNMWNELFEKYDAVILPVEKGPAELIDEVLTKKLTNEERVLSDHLQIGNFGGFPSITIPSGFVDGLPVGLNITGKRYGDENILQIANIIEEKFGYKGQIAKEVNNG